MSAARPCVDRDVPHVLAGVVFPARRRRADHDRRRRGGVPVQRGRAGQQFRTGVAAHHGVDDAGLHPAVPAAAGLGSVGVGRGRAEGQVAAVLENSHRQRRQLIVIAGHERRNFFEELHGDPQHVDRVPQRDPPGQILRHEFEGPGGVVDVAARVGHPLHEVHDGGLHDQRQAGPLRGLQLGEERQTVLHGRHRLGGEPTGILLQPPQQRLRNAVQQFQRRPRRRELLVGHP